MKLKVILTGATGMVGEGVLQECLLNPDVEKILVINRKPCGVSNPKLEEIIHENFYDISPITEQLKGYNACFFCLGISSIGMKEAQYFSITYTLTLDFAHKLAAANPEITFCYISGTSTDSTEKGRMMWARVKGKTENDLIKLPFKAVYNFRPGFLQPFKGAKNVNKYFVLIGFIYPFLRWISPKYFLTLQELGKAMIYASTKGYEKKILEVSDISKASKG